MVERPRNSNTTGAVDNVVVLDDHRPRAADRALYKEASSALTTYMEDVYAALKKEKTIDPLLLVRKLRDAQHHMLTMLTVDRALEVPESLLTELDIAFSTAESIALGNRGAISADAFTLTIESPLRAQVQKVAQDIAAGVVTLQKPSL